MASFCTLGPTIIAQNIGLGERHYIRVERSISSHVAVQKLILGWVGYPRCAIPVIQLTQRKKTKKKKLKIVMDNFMGSTTFDGLDLLHMDRF